ncbi:MAG: hypothetical protein L0Z73_08705 [Gammaproteobacteria bacterium]|nr:hypothetical protein [Gammaproteobacteria bacterium]
MDDVIFYRLDRVKFSLVDMSKAGLFNTNLIGATFFNVNWYQKCIGRNGLAKECITRKSSERWVVLHDNKVLEQSCHNIRLALERNKDYLVASDFYVGEMEARLRQYGFARRYLLSVEALYGALSRFGVDPTRALLVFFLVVCVHSFISSSFSEQLVNVLSAVGLDESSSVIGDTLKTVCAYIINSLKVMTLMKGEDIIQNLGWLDAIFRIFGPIQLALVAFSIRAKIKRH